MYANLFPSEHPEPGPIEYAGNRFKSKLLAQRSNFCTAIQTPFLQHHLNIRFLRSKFVKKYYFSIFFYLGIISSHRQPSSSPLSPPSDRGRCPQCLWCNEESRLGTSCPFARLAWTCAKSPPEKEFFFYNNTTHVPVASTKLEYQVHVPIPCINSMY